MLFSTSTCAALFVTVILGLSDLELISGSMVSATHHVNVDNYTVALSYFPYEETWTSFTQIHEKAYNSNLEERRRFAVFVNNVQMIENHNKLFVAGLTSYFLSVNQFTDMEEWELAEFHGLDVNLSEKSGRVGSGWYFPEYRPCKSFAGIRSDEHIPDEMDWRKRGYVTRVKNQGHCGACWGFSAAGGLEGQYYKKTGILRSLSVQQLVDCSRNYGTYGCHGGLPDKAYHYLIKAGGDESWEDYPYEMEDYSECRFDKSKISAPISGCVDIMRDSETQLLQAVATVGPVSIGANAHHFGFHHYAGGVYDNPDCTHHLTHAMLAVGYGTLNGQDYWLVKNSWGPNWGNEGYLMMSRNKDNQCGIASLASYPIV